MNDMRYLSLLLLQFCISSFFWRNSIFLSSSSIKPCLYNYVVGLQ